MLDIIAVNYNAIGVDRPPRTAQGLTLLKGSKEYAKQELLLAKRQSDFKSNISEPTKESYGDDSPDFQFYSKRQKPHTR